MGKLVVSLDGVVIKEVQITKDKTTLGRRPYNDSVMLESHLHELLAGDLVLLCSDGLSDMLDDEHIGHVLQSSEDIQAIAHALISAANEAGGKDNIAVILARVQGAAGGPRSWWPFKR